MPVSRNKAERVFMKIIQSTAVPLVYLFVYAILVYISVCYLYNGNSTEFGGRVRIISELQMIE